MSTTIVSVCMLFCSMAVTSARAGDIVAYPFVPPKLDIQWKVPNNNARGDLTVFRKAARQGWKVQYRASHGGGDGFKLALFFFDNEGSLLGECPFPAEHHEDARTYDCNDESTRAATQIAVYAVDASKNTVDVFFGAVDQVLLDGGKVIKKIVK